MEGRETGVDVLYEREDFFFNKKWVYFFKKKKATDLARPAGPQTQGSSCLLVPALWT